MISSTVGGIHNSFATVKFQQFEYHNKKLTKATKKYLPTTVGLAAFIKPHTPDSVIQKLKDGACGLAYDLGYDYFLEKGNEHIKYRFSSDRFNDSPSDTSWVLGNLIEFIWTGDGFIRKKVR